MGEWVGGGGRIRGCEGVRELGLIKRRGRCLSVCVTRGDPQPVRVRAVIVCGLVDCGLWTGALWTEGGEL